MTDDLVKNEIHAVRTLQGAVARYAEQLRGVIAHARREVTAADTRAHEAVERRRSELHRRETELKAAQTQLARCQENCGGLQQRVHAADQRCAEARQQLELARKAAGITASARSDLNKAMAGTEATVGEQSSIAAAALASLGTKLAALTGRNLGHALHNLGTGTIIGVKITTAAIDVSRIGADAAAAFNVNLPSRDTGIAQIVEHQRDQHADYVIETVEDSQEKPFQPKNE
jgi:hypothetical protein